MKRDRDPLFLAFGQALKSFREAAGVSQEALALEAGIDRTFVSRLEVGMTQPTLRTVFALAVALGVSPDELVKKTADRIPRRGGPRHR